MWAGCVWPYLASHVTKTTPAQKKAAGLLRTVALSGVPQLSFAMGSSRSEYCVEMMARLNAQRGHAGFSDVTLVVQGREFKAHRSVLAAASPYFDMMFTCDMREKQQKSVHLEGLSISVMEYTLDYIYTGAVHMKCTDESLKIAEDLVVSSNYLMLPELKSRAGDYLIQNLKLNISNCVIAYYFAKTYECHNLLQNAREFVNLNFVSVSESEEFLALTADQMCEWISSDDIIVNAEKDVFKVVLKWLGSQQRDEREKYFLHLFKSVHLTSLTRQQLLEEILGNRQVRRNAKCLELAHEAFKQIPHDSDSPVKNPTRKCLESYVDALVFSCGEKMTWCYVPVDRPDAGPWVPMNSWHRLENRLSERNFHTVTSCRGYMYDVGCLNLGLSLAERYDPRLNKWFAIEAPPQDLTQGCAVALQGFVYLIGGVSQWSGQWVDSVYRYDPDDNSWEYITPLNIPRSGICAVADDNHIYAIGGRTESTFFDTVECFEPKSNTWSFLTSMNECRAGASAAIVRENMFVLGGLHTVMPGSMALKTCEMYNFAIHQWQVISSMQVPKYNVTAVAIGDTIYVFGSGPCRKFEVYNTRTDEWMCWENMHSEIFIYKGCTMRLCKTVTKQLVPFSR